LKTFLIYPIEGWFTTRHMNHILVRTEELNKMKKNKEQTEKKNDGTMKIFLEI
jgi:hypothetical protein